MKWKRKGVKVKTVFSASDLDIIGYLNSFKLPEFCYFQNRIWWKCVHVVGKPDNVFLNIWILLYHIKTS